MRIAGHVDQQITEQAIDQPGRRGAALRAAVAQLLQRDLQLVQLLVASLVDPRRLAGRANEQR